MLCLCYWTCLLLCVVINKDNINVRKRRGGPTPSLEPEEDPNRKRRDVHLTYKKQLFMGKTVSCYLTKIPTCKEFQDAKTKCIKGESKSGGVGWKQVLDHHVGLGFFFWK